MDKKDIPEQYQAIVADARAQANKWLDRHMDKVAACDPEVLMKAYLYYASQRDAGNIKFTDKNACGTATESRSSRMPDVYGPYACAREA